MRGRKCARIATILLAVTVMPVVAATVTIDPIAKKGDAVPGRPAGFTFWGESLMRPPVVNEGGEVVFRAKSASTFDVNSGSAFGIYVKRPLTGLAVLVDTTVDLINNPTFSVPGQPAGTRFLDFKAPLLNLTGDVVFQGRFQGGSGLYAVRTSGGGIVKLADTSDAVPGGGGALFVNFNNAGLSGALDGLTLAALNDAGQVAFFARFNGIGAAGLYGTSVAGGVPVVLADTLQTVTPTNLPGTPGPFRDIRPEIALNNAGVLAFRGSVGPVPSLRGGLFTAPVDGSAAPDTRVFRSQPAPGSTGVFSDVFADQDINESGTVVFGAQLANIAGGGFGLYAVSPTGGVSRIVDTLGTLPVPNRMAGSSFSTTILGSINESGAMGFFARTSSTGIVSDMGIYAADTAGSPLAEIAARGILPPGQAFPADLRFFDEGLSAVVDDAGDMAFTASGASIVGTLLRGVYFFDVCAGSLNRIADSTTSSAELGGTFTGPGTQKFSLYQAGTAHSGNYRGLTNAGDLAFLAQYSNQDFGMFVAHVTVGGGGALAITCPPDAALACPADTSPGSAGTATATGCGSITITSTDVTAPNCGATATATRTWTATSGTATASCLQTITVSDTTAPALTGVPANVTAECTAIPTPVTPTAPDACDISPVITLSEGSVPGTCPNESVLTRTWTATDACGNESTAAQVITVMDTTPPVLSGVPANALAECSAIPAPATPVAMDGCGGSAAVTLAESTTPGVCSNSFVLTRTWTAADACGNTATATQSVTVVDMTPPMLSGVPLDAVVECDAVPAVALVTAIDACDGTPTVTFGETQTGACLANATVTRTWTAHDSCGNSSAAGQVITVHDTTPPVASASLTLFGDGDNEDSRAGDDDEGVFVIGASCADNCEGLPGCSSTVLSAVLSCGNGVAVAVSPGQSVELEDEDEGQCEVELENGQLEIEGRVTLTVTCTDAAGNTSTATAVPVGLAPDNDNETELDD